MNPVGWLAIGLLVGLSVGFAFRGSPWRPGLVDTAVGAIGGLLGGWLMSVTFGDAAPSVLEVSGPVGAVVGSTFLLGLGDVLRFSIVKPAFRPPGRAAEGAVKV